MVKTVQFNRHLELCNEMIRAGRKVGAGADFYRTLANNEELFRRVVDIVKREIVGPLYTAAQVFSAFKIPYSKKEIAALGAPPQPLRGYVTFFDPGFSIHKLREVVRSRGNIFYPQIWYDDADERFAHENESPCYRRLRMEAAPDSFGRTFDEQQKLLASDEVVPSARIIVMGMVIHFLVSGERLFPAGWWVRSSDKDALDCRVRVGNFDSYGLTMNFEPLLSRDNSVGLSSVKKS